MKSVHKDNNLARLRWACRRGMLELDVLLGNFLNQCYEELEPKLQHDFTKLLTYTDPEIFDWLLGNSPRPPEFKQLVHLILSCKHLKSN